MVAAAVMVMVIVVTNAVARAVALESVVAILITAAAMAEW